MLDGSHDEEGEEFRHVEFSLIEQLSLHFGPNSYSIPPALLPLSNSQRLLTVLIINQTKLGVHYISSTFQVGYDVLIDR